MTRYHLHGLTVESPVLLRADVARRHDAPPDLVVEYRGERAVPDELCPGALLQGYTSGSQLLCTTVRCDDGSTVLRLHGSVEFEICPDRRTVQAWNDPRCSLEMLGIFVVGHLLSTVLALRGETVLHASAVEIDGIAVAFVADSGIGKSTMAALACARGARFVTDDVLRLRECPDPGLWCWPGPTENRLRRDLTDISPTYHGTATRTSADGRTVWSPRGTNRDRCRLGAIVLPAPEREQEHLEMRLLPPATALVELSRRPRIHGWLDHRVLTDAFRTLTRIVRDVPVYTARVPWGPPFDDAVVDALLERCLGAPTTCASRLAQA